MFMAARNPEWVNLIDSRLAIFFLFFRLYKYLEHVSLSAVFCPVPKVENITRLMAIIIYSAHIANYSQATFVLV